MRTQNCLCRDLCDESTPYLEVTANSSASQAARQELINLRVLPDLGEALSDWWDKSKAVQV